MQDSVVSTENSNKGRDSKHETTSFGLRIGGFKTIQKQQIGWIPLTYVEHQAYLRGRNAKDCQDEAPSQLQVRFDHKTKNMNDLVEMYA